MKRTLISQLITFAVILLSGCIAVPVTTVHPVAEAPASRSVKRLCVVTPLDASRDDTGSGRAIAQQIVASLARIGMQASIVTETAEVSLKVACFERGASLAVVPEILFYEDNLTGWSGKPDRIELRISAFDPREPSARRSFIFEAASNTVASALLEWGNAKPYALVAKNVDQALRTLIQSAMEASERSVHLRDAAEASGKASGTSTN